MGLRGRVHRPPGCGVTVGQPVGEGPPVRSGGFRRLLVQAVL